MHIRHPCQIAGWTDKPRLFLGRGEPGCRPYGHHLEGVLGLGGFADRDVFVQAELVLGEAMQRLVLWSPGLVGYEPAAALMPDLAHGIALAFPEPVHRRRLRRRLQGLLVDPAVWQERQHHLVAVPRAAVGEITASGDLEADAHPGHDWLAPNARSRSAAHCCR